MSSILVKVTVLYCEALTPLLSINEYWQMFWQLDKLLGWGVTCNGLFPLLFLFLLPPPPPPPLQPFIRSHPQLELWPLGRLNVLCLHRVTLSYSQPIKYVRFNSEHTGTSSVKPSQRSRVFFLTKRLPFNNQSLLLNLSFCKSSTPSLKIIY